MNSVGVFERAHIVEVEEGSEYITNLLQEREQLRRYTEELERALKATQRQLEERQRMDVWMQGLLNHSPAGVFVKDTHGRYLFVNQRTAASFQLTPEQIIGKTDDELFPKRSVEKWRMYDEPVTEEGKTVKIEVVLHQEDGLHTYLVTRFPLYDDRGHIYAFAGVSADITDRKQTNTARAVMQLQIKDAQQETLRELSTPLMPLADHVIAMPLIGTIDEIRAKQIMETILDGVSRYRAEIAILDITGVKTVDTQVAQALLHTAHAVKMLGSQVIITGIRPPIAQVLVQLGIDMEGIITRSTLQSGIAYALNR